MATAKRTSNHGEIRNCAESRGGKPAIAGTGVLRIAFGKPEENLKPVDWYRFFDLFDSSGVDFLYDPEGHFNKFVSKE